MKKALPLFFLVSTLSLPGSQAGFGQITMTSIAAGDFYSPATWDCICFPADGDTVIINHAVTMSFGIPYTAGQIQINASGSLTNSTDLDIYINGGTFINAGIVSVGEFLLDSGYVNNSGTMTFDSLLTRDNVDNTGDITAYDFAHDQYATFTSDGDITITNNFNNEGDFFLNGLLEISNDASNCNIQTSNALMQIEGIMCIGNDFINCGTDTLRSAGTGALYIGGFSTNAGEVQGSLTVNDAGGGFDLNTGTIAGTVTMATALCGLGMDESSLSDWTIYPNPAVNSINSSIPDVDYFIYDLTGKMLAASHSQSGLIDIGFLSDGLYALQLMDSAGRHKTEIISKR